MKRLILITHNNHNKDTIDLLAKAAEKYNVKVIELVNDSVTKEDIISIKINSNDGLYRAGITDQARQLEKDVLEYAIEQPKKLRKSTVRVDGWEEVNLFLEHGINVIPSIQLSKKWKNFNSEKINSKVLKLGGYPIILKKMGLSHGQGVQLIGDVAKLQTVISNIKDDEINEYGLRMFIKNYRHARVIVVGGQVIDSIEYIKPNNDFRTNATDNPLVKPAKFSKSIYAACEKAAKIRETSFGGVDVLIDNKSGAAYIAEYNDPCNFARAELITGVKISEKIIEHLFA